MVTGLMSRGLKMVLLHSEVRPFVLIKRLRILLNFETLFYCYVRTNYVKSYFFLSWAFLDNLEIIFCQL